jgi:hypothetical protein
LSELQALIHGLAPLDRQIILLYLEGATAAEIADVTGTTPGNTATKIHRIKKLMNRQEPLMNAHNDPQDLWKSNDPALPHPPATTEICALARRREREGLWGRGIRLFGLAGFAIAFAHNAFEIDQPWVRLGQGWMLILMTVYLWSLIRDHTGRRASHETCAAFLLRSLKRKRDGFLAVCRSVLLIPAVLASWWGGGPALKARAMGLDPSSPYDRYLTSVWPIVATCVLLEVIWFAFSGAAKKASVELEALRERITAA